VYEVALSLAAAVVAGAWFVLTSPGLEAEPARDAAVGVLPLVLLALHPTVFGPFAGALLARLRREPLPLVLGAGQVARFLALYTFTALLGGVSLCLFVLAIHPADPSDLPVIAAAVPVGFVVAVVTLILPAGLGSRDITIAAVLATVLPAGVAVAAAAGFPDSAARGRAGLGGRSRCRRSPRRSAPPLRSSRSRS
jgi:glycosyltransferase 2 family protein